MAHATRRSGDEVDRIVRLTEEWKAISDPAERRLLLEEIGRARIAGKPEADGDLVFGLEPPEVVADDGPCYRLTRGRDRGGLEGLGL
jgi:hypothetical protein